jgi:transcriptional regulator with XRE-family HTH domain
MKLEPHHKLRILRIKQELTQESLAREFGVSKQYLSLVELGKAVPSKLFARVIQTVTEGWGEPIEAKDWRVE